MANAASAPTSACVGDASRDISRSATRVQNAAKYESDHSSLAGAGDPLSESHQPLRVSRIRHRAR